MINLVYLGIIPILVAVAYLSEKPKEYDHEVMSEKDVDPNKSNKKRKAILVKSYFRYN